MPPVQKTQLYLRSNSKSKIETAKLEENKHPLPQNQQPNEPQIREEISSLKNSLKELNNKPYQIQLEEFYQQLEIDDEKAYRNKMKGFHLPFNTKEKHLRIPDDTLFKKAKKMDARTAAEIKRILQQRKEQHFQEVS